MAVGLATVPSQPDINSDSPDRHNRQYHRSNGERQEQPNRSKEKTRPYEYDQKPEPIYPYILPSCIN